jgi:hypothetical protein
LSQLIELHIKVEWMDEQVSIVLYSIKVIRYQIHIKSQHD